MAAQTQEARIILAIEAIRTSKKLNCSSAAKLYDVSYSTLSDRINGRTTLCERPLLNLKLTKLEEEVIV